jgi:hypothetical protein
VLRSERAAAEPEEEELVAWLEVLHEEAISLADIARQAKAENSPADVLPPVGADSPLVEDPLLPPGGILRRICMATSVTFVGAVTGVTDRRYLIF